jgi:hypothetical protein
MPMEVLDAIKGPKRKEGPGKRQSKSDPPSTKASVLLSDG